MKHVFFAVALALHFAFSFARLESITRIAGNSAASSHGNIRSSLWQNFLDTYLHDWRGYWIRTDMSGRLYALSNSTRSWKIAMNETDRPPQNILQTNTYTNPRWHSNGDTTRRWWITNTTQPQSAVRIFDNGRVIPALGNNLYVRSNGDTVSMFNTPLTGRIFSFEQWLVHPHSSDFRFSVTPVYVHGRFVMVSFVREQADALFYGSRFWTVRTSSRRLSDVPFLIERRFWVASDWCVNSNYDVTTRPEHPVSAGFELPSQPKDRMFVLQLPDFVFLFAPIDVLDFEKRNIQMMLLWVIEKKLIKRAVLDFDRSGFLTKVCISTYRKIV